MEQLLAAGAKLQLSDAELCSALCSAVEAGQEQLLRRFIAAGTNVSAIDHNKQTALHLAAAQGKLNLVRIVCIVIQCCFRWCGITCACMHLLHHQQTGLFWTACVSLSQYFPSSGTFNAGRSPVRMLRSLQECVRLGLGDRSCKQPFTAAGAAHYLVCCRWFCWLNRATRMSLLLTALAALRWMKLSRHRQLM